MGGVILILLLILLVTMLVLPAVRERLAPRPPNGVQPADEPPHEVVVHKLDDHRGKKPGD